MGTPFPFLTDSAHVALDADLARLGGSLSQSSAKVYGTIASSVLAVIEGAEGKLIYPNWRDTWRDSGFVASGWFGDTRRDEVAQALHALFTEMVRYVESATTQNRKEKYAVRLAEALREYLSLRGCQVTSHTPPQQATGPVPNGEPPVIADYLQSWRDILDCLKKKNTRTNRDQVRRTNEQCGGPIAFTGKGSQPKVNKAKLIDWWNHLEALWETGGVKRRLDTEATTEARYNYGRDGTVVPNISGHTQKRRGNKSAE
jgi:hypothetical protein